MAEFDSIRQLPHSQEAEQALLGAVLLDPEKFNEIVFLKPEYFYEEQHQQIYTAMLEMYNTNRSIEIVNLVDALTRLGLFNDGNAYKYIQTAHATRRPTISTPPNVPASSAIRRCSARLSRRFASCRRRRIPRSAAPTRSLPRLSGASSPLPKTSSTSPSTASATCCATTSRCSSSFRTTPTCSAA